METRETVVLRFTTSLGGRHNIRINNPRPVVTAAGLAAPVSMFVDNQFFDSTVGRLTGLFEANRVTVTTQTII